MGIDATHPLYNEYFDRWRRCRDAYEGEDAVKARGKKYLPQPGGLDNGEFDAYVARALFYEAVGRTIDGFVGAISRKEPTLEIPAKLQPVVDTATADGLSLEELSKLLCAETILEGRGGLLVDFDETSERPHFAFYPAEAITNWDAEGGIVLAETLYERDPEDQYKQVAVQQIRQLSLVDGRYTVTIWRRNQNKVTVGDDWVVANTLTPTMRGTPLSKVPFYWLTPGGRTSTVAKPPLLGLVNVSLSHYRNSADLEHGRHFTGLPTLYATGMADNDAPIRVGALAAITISDPHAKVGYAEFSGQGLRSLEVALDAKENMMAVLGASVFNDGPKGVEAAETARIRTSGETSLLSGVVTTVEATLEAALQCAADWMGIPGEIAVTLNREFVDTSLDGPTLTGLVQAYQAGALSLPQFLYNLQQGEMLAPDTDIEEEVKAVQAEAVKRQQDAIKMAQATKPTAPAEN